MQRVKLLLWKNIKPFQWRLLWALNPKFIIGVNGIIISEDGSILLLRHKFWPKDSWGLPSGYTQPGETLEEALTREVKEETGYIIEVDKLIKITSGYRLRIEVAYLGKIVDGELNIDPSEIIEARFFPLDNLPTGLLDTHRDLIGEGLGSLR